jgi:hypothetical protein
MPLDETISEQHQQLGAERQVDAVSLRDEDRGEAGIHHRAGEVEGIAQRQHEARDAARNAEAVELLEHLGQAGFGGGGREGDQHRLADVAEEDEGALAQEQRARAQRQQAQQDQPP